MPHLRENEPPPAWLSLRRHGVHVEWDCFHAGRWRGYVRVFERESPRVAWSFDAATGQPWLEPVGAVVWHFDGMIVEVKMLMAPLTPRQWAALMSMGRVLGARAYQRERWDVEARTKRTVVRAL